jgi:NAD(P)H-dependent flavin oxidoreductase YrpB (nitropropane dioxygenase family)
MAGVTDAELAIAVAKAAGLGALPASMINPEQLRTQVTQFPYSHCGQANQFELVGAQGSRAK